MPDPRVVPLRRIRHRRVGRSGPRALVNTGRKPLAENLGLVLPADIADERRMWTLVGKLSRLPYDDKAAALNPYRSAPPSGNP
ncbi:hypothetical protein ACWGQ5_20560 [Streptomyces sp. NPDC055722]